MYFSGRYWWRQSDFKVTRGCTSCGCANPNTETEFHYGVYSSSDRGGSLRSDQHQELSGRGPGAHLLRGSDDIGGLWRFKEHPEPGRANIYQSVIINSSKEIMSYSDFPPPAHLPNNMHHSQTTVVSVRQRPDFPVSGQWEVETERTEGQRETQVFDAVVVCTGHYTQPHLPLNDFPGIEEFEGRYLHSWEYRSAEGLQGKRVVVVRIGNSGGDIAVDASRVAEQVYLSTRRGAWVVSRVGAGGLPGDLMGTSRLDGLLQKLFPSWITRMIEKNLNQSFDHRLYGLQPKHGFFAQIPVVNDDLPGRIISGRVLVKPGRSEAPVDVVVFATGYNYDFHFLPSSLRAKSGHRLSLYRHVFPPGLTRPTLAVVGFIHGLGAINPLAEMQARWATRVFKGLPVRSVILSRWIICHTWTHPNLLGLLLRELGVGLRVLLGPCTPYQYRLRGPGQWDGARQAILTQWERVAQPFRTRLVTVPPRPWARLSPWLITLSGGAVMLAVVISQCNLTSALQYPAHLLD
ncbi:hypothetical protein J4Q44_G00154840 [Coregonus suidteri]|uniref:Flavin-containing monooxygenase n=1 Tax=Coregonus suidteri TaxID=861788 RepID=A0AAN8LLE0_9TELE